MVSYKLKQNNAAAYTQRQAKHIYSSIELMPRQVT